MVTYLSLRTKIVRNKKIQLIQNYNTLKFKKYIIILKYMTTKCYFNMNYTCINFVLIFFFCQVYTLKVKSYPI